MCVVLCVDVTFLQQDTDGGRILGIDPSIRTKFCVVPLHVITRAFEDDVRGDGVPDGLVGQQERFLRDHLFLSGRLDRFLDRVDVVLSDHLQQRL